MLLLVVDEQLDLPKGFQRMDKALQDAGGNNVRVHMEGAAEDL